MEAMLLTSAIDDRCEIEKLRIKVKELEELLNEVKVILRAMGGVGFEVSPNSNS